MIVEAEALALGITAERLLACRDAALAAAGAAASAVDKYSRHAAFRRVHVQTAAAELRRAGSPLEYMTKLRQLAASAGLQEVLA